MAKSLLRSTSIVSSMTFISRILGFVRDMLAAQIFGVNASVDAFNTAFKIPNFMRNLFAEGSFSQAFVPVLSEYRQTKSFTEAQNFIRHICGCLSLVLLIVTLIGILASSSIVSVISPGFEPLRFHWASEMLKVTFPYLMLISLTAFCGAILNSYGSFAVPAFTPAILNIVLIITAIYLSPHLNVPVESQTWGVLIAGFAQLFFQLPFLAQKGLLPWPIASWKDPGVRKVLKLMLPALLGSSVTQISLLLNTVFASFLAVGSVSWLYFSERLAYFPLGVFGVALATVVLPHLSRKHADNNPEQFQKGLDWGIRCNLLVGLPSTIALLFFAGPMLATLFLYKRFQFHDLLMTQQSLMAYAIGLQAFMLVKLLASGFYARKDIKTPVKIAIIAMIFNAILNAAFIIPLHHAGLALATSGSSWLNCLLLGYILWKRKIMCFQSGWSKFIVSLIIANGIMAAILWYGHGQLITWQIHSGSWRIAHLFFWLISSFIAYLITLFLLGFRLSYLRGIS